MSSDPFVHSTSVDEQNTISHLSGHSPPSHCVCVKKEKCRRAASESQGRVTHDPEKCEFGLLILLRNLETFKDVHFLKFLAARQTG